MYPWLIKEEVEAGEPAVCQLGNMWKKLRSVGGAKERGACTDVNFTKYLLTNQIDIKRVVYSQSRSCRLGNASTP